jgi:hypothetical protein
MKLFLYRHARLRGGFALDMLRFQTVSVRIGKINCDPT